MDNKTGIIFVDEHSIDNLNEKINGLSKRGGGLVIISSNVQKGVIYDELPGNVRIIDLRYGGVSLLNKKHPRQEGFWTQYSYLQTGLAKNFTISDTIHNETKIENWESKDHLLQQAPYGKELSSEEYRHQHNHYQNLLCETFNFSNNLNAVSIWGDSGAFVPGAKSWGAFFSARSWPVKWNGYSPEYSWKFDDKDFDAALVGVEIDVLNAGKDWGDPSPLLSSSMAKVGLQIVGFGKRNTAAIEIRTEDSDDPKNAPETRSGAWEWGMIVRNALHENSTLIHCENGKINRGIDLSRSTYKEGALLISPGTEKSGIVFNHGVGGEIYSDYNDTLVIKTGDNGIRIKLSDSEFIEIRKNGEISLSQNILNSLRKLLREDE